MFPTAVKSRVIRLSVRAALAGAGLVAAAARGPH
jgi:hypothetical protein